MNLISNTNYDFKWAKDTYRAFCESESHDIPVFALPWFLDSVSNSIDDWQVIIYYDNHKVLAAFPFEYIKSKKGGYIIRNPYQAKRLGIWIDYGNKQTNVAKETFENKVTQYVIDNLPKFDSFNIEFDARYTNWRVFFNNGFNQQTKYSYIMRLLSSEEEYNKVLTAKRRSEINRKKNDVIIDCEPDINKYWNFLVESYKLRNKELLANEEKTKNLLKAVMQHDAVDFLFSINEHKQVVGAKIYFKDNRRVYEMFSTFDPREKPSSLPVLTYTEILNAYKEGLEFDFEGSMESGVALYNREFGGVQEPYFVITKLSDSYRFHQNIREIVGFLKKFFWGKFSRK